MTRYKPECLGMFWSAGTSQTVLGRKKSLGYTKNLTVLESVRENWLRLVTIKSVCELLRGTRELPRPIKTV
ncbi:hypothetical protein DPMN_150309 [Dreissena polymorpha]|uniref:Uncharacterized protein n=1 Tax=Dreissena polymorpha TaxID=45954 RepID=A0A9D4FFI2_DREPO|nr:hypothetical protein DPMN_150309 [Dreissena polymorpha]